MPIDDCYALYAHLRHGSVIVAEGDQVAIGAQVGAVGHTGNSTAPHLHFQLMTKPDPREAAPIPCAFDSYERRQDARWIHTARGIPAKGQRIRT